MVYHHRKLTKKKYFLSVEPHANKQNTPNKYYFCQVKIKKNIWCIGVCVLLSVRESVEFWEWELLLAKDIGGRSKCAGITREDKWEQKQWKSYALFGDLIHISCTLCLCSRWLFVFVIKFTRMYAHCASRYYFVVVIQAARETMYFTYILSAVFHMHSSFLVGFVRLKGQWEMVDSNKLYYWHIVRVVWLINLDNILIKMDIIVVYIQRGFQVCQHTKNLFIPVHIFITLPLNDTSHTYQHQLTS